MDYEIRKIVKLSRVDKLYSLARKDDKHGFLTELASLLRTAKVIGFQEGWGKGKEVSANGQ